MTERKFSIADVLVFVVILLPTSSLLLSTLSYRQARGLGVGHCLICSKDLGGGSGTAYYKKSYSSGQYTKAKTYRFCSSCAPNRIDRNESFGRGGLILRLLLLLLPLAFLGFSIWWAFFDKELQFPPGPDDEPLIVYSVFFGLVGGWVPLAYVLWSDTYLPLIYLLAGFLVAWLLGGMAIAGIWTATHTGGANKQVEASD